MVFEKSEHRLFFDEVFGIPEIDIVMDGKIDVTENGAASGVINLTSNDINLNGQLSIKNGLLTYTDSEANIQVDVYNLEAVHLNSGVHLSYKEASTKLFASIKSKKELSGEEKALLSILSLSSTDQFLVNRERAKRIGSSQDIDNMELRRNCNWYDHVVAGAVASAVAGVFGSSCVALGAGCAGVTVLTLGGFSVPCFVVAGLCATGAVASWDSTYEYLLDNWLCEPTTCLFQPPQLVWSNATYNNTVRLNWSSVSGAQRYQVVQWVGYWTSLGETTNTSITINGLASGGVYYFGVRTICNNTATNDASWTTVFN